MNPKITYSQWEIKQIIDVVSKGVNSILMNEKKPDFADLKDTALKLTDLYEQILYGLKQRGDSTPAWARGMSKGAVRSELIEEAGNEVRAEEDTKVEPLPTVNIE